MFGSLWVGLATRAVQRLLSGNPARRPWSLSERDYFTLATSLRSRLDRLAEARRLISIDEAENIVFGLRQPYDSIVRSLLERDVNRSLSDSMPHPTGPYYLVPDLVVSELPTLRATLVLNEPSAFGEFDRNMAEAELRFSLVAPAILLAVSLILTLPLSGPESLAFGAAVTGFLVGITIQGTFQYRRAIGLLATAVAENRLTTPLLLAIDTIAPPAHEPLD